MPAARYSEVRFGVPRSACILKTPQVSVINEQLNWEPVQMRVSRETKEEQVNVIPLRCFQLVILTEVWLAIYKELSQHFLNSQPHFQKWKISRMTWFSLPFYKWRNSSKYVMLKDAQLSRHRAGSHATMLPLDRGQSHSSPWRTTAPMLVTISWIALWAQEGAGSLMGFILFHSYNDPVR